MLSIPLHTIHKKQSFDVSFFRSLKLRYNIEIGKFLRTHQDQNIAVHQVSKLVSGSVVAASSVGTAVNSTYNL